MVIIQQKKKNAQYLYILTWKQKFAYQCKAYQSPPPRMLGI